MTCPIFRLHSTSRRSAWNSNVDRMALSRRLLTASSWGRFEQFARRMVADRRDLAFTAFGFGPRPLDAFDRGCE